MKKIIVTFQILAVALVLVPSAFVAQKKPVVAATKNIVFAVLNDGKMVEPIGFIDKGELNPPIGGDSDSAAIKLFNSTYYRKGAVYDLIFGGVKGGTVSVVKSDHTAECSANMAEVTVTAAKAKLAGKRMALATNFKTTKSGSGVRRLPTSVERVEADKLVKAEFAKQGNSAATIETRDYHNLTALDVDNDGNIELVGSFWVKPDAKSRNTLFFIADKGTDGKFRIGFGKYNAIKEENVMSGDITTIDGGVYHELLLDVLDVNNDGVSEIFSYSQSFEGAGFNAYRRVNGKWDLAFEGSNYHCGF
jgi:hypothetical protein